MKERIIRRLYEEGHINVEEMLILLDSNTSKYVILPDLNHPEIDLSDLKDLPNTLNDE